MTTSTQPPIVDGDEAKRRGSSSSSSSRGTTSGRRSTTNVDEPTPVAATVSEEHQEDAATASADSATTAAATNDSAALVHAQQEVPVDTKVVDNEEDRKLTKLGRCMSCMTSQALYLISYCLLRDFDSHFTSILKLMTTKKITSRRLMRRAELTRQQSTVPPIP